MKTKICTGCNKEKDLSEFARYKAIGDKTRSACKECIRLINKKYYIDHREQILLKVENYQKENK